MIKSAISKSIGVVSSVAVWLTLAQVAFAQTSSTASASKGGLTSSGSSLPAAGSTELTYLIFIGGAILFIVGAVKLVASYRE